MNDIIYRQDAIDILSKVNCGLNAATIVVLESLPSARDCKGCKHQSQWENEYEMGYPSPCTGCMRRSKDNYER